MSEHSPCDHYHQSYAKLPYERARDCTDCTRHDTWVDQAGNTITTSSIAPDSDPALAQCALAEYERTAADMVRQGYRHVGNGKESDE
jgi:hypothetical protein